MNDSVSDLANELVIEPTKQLCLITTKPGHTISIGHDTDQAAEPCKRAKRHGRFGLSGG
jgi:hypothetical protein